METYNVQKLPFWKKIMYALGQFGWSLGSYGVGNLLVYFYMPPEEAGSAPIFPEMIYQGKILGFLTIIGLIFAFGRLWDAVTDPMIATASDRSKFKLGRRRSFLLISAVPFALLSFLAFFPIGTTSAANTIYLWIVIFFFYLAMTAYVTPFFAWMSELGHSPDERLTLSTMISITWALGFATGSQALQFAKGFEDAGYSALTAFQITMAIFAVISLVLMLLPVIFINEKKYCEPNVSDQGVLEAVFSAFKNKNFLLFTLSDLAYWVALTFISVGLVYYVTTLLNLPKEFYSHLMIVMFGISFLFYVPVNIIAKKIGKKTLLVVAFIIFVLDYILVMMLGKLPMSSVAQGYLIAVVSAMPLAIFGILPNAIISDIAEADGIDTGNFKAGIFFGARTFMSKIGQMVAALVFPSLLLLGKSNENPMGVRLSGLAAMIFCVCGLLLFFKYDEKKVLKTLAKKEKLSAEEMAEIQK